MQNKPLSSRSTLSQEKKDLLNHYDILCSKALSFLQSILKGLIPCFSSIPLSKATSSGHFRTFKKPRTTPSSISPIRQMLLFPDSASKIRYLFHFLLLFHLLPHFLILFHFFSVFFS